MINWTLAYRTPRANHFKRVTNWEGTWHQARELAAKLLETEPGLQVYYVQSAASELAETKRLAQEVASGRIMSETAYSYLEDHGNILVAETRRRVKMRETGQLSAELLAQVPNAAEAKARFEADAH
jgi:hypothetical protein